MNFEILISEEIQNISKYFSFSFTKIWPLRKEFFENFSISNTICAEAAKSLTGVLTSEHTSWVLEWVCF
jgi:phage-related protein